MDSRRPIFQRNCPQQTCQWSCGLGGRTFCRIRTLGCRGVIDAPYWRRLDQLHRRSNDRDKARRSAYNKDAAVAAEL